MDYRTVYDIGAQGYQDWAFVWIAAGLAVAAALLFVRLRASGRSRLPAYLVGALAATFAAFSCLATAWDYRGLRAALADGRAIVAEGAVEDHQTQRIRFAEGTRQTLMWESFVLDGVRFGYYRDASAHGFRNAGPGTLALRDGIWLRVHYVRDRDRADDALRIVRLEAADAAAPSREAALGTGDRGG